MIDSHINPSLESWVITTATRPNTEFQIPANIPNGSELYDTVRKTSDKNIPANNEVEKHLGLFEPMETCLTWTQWVSTKTVIIHTHFILETTDHSLPFICPQKHGRKDHLCVISPTAWPFSSANTCADIKSNIHYWIESRTVIGTDHPQTTTEKGQNHLKNHNNNLCDWVIEKKNSQIKKIVK